MRLIDADALMETLGDFLARNYEPIYDLDDIGAMEWPVKHEQQKAAWMKVLRKVIEAGQAVDAAPVVHGHWIKMTGMMPPEYHGHYECSECQWHMKGLRNSWTREEELSYCPNCGAKMDAEVTA